ncbi:MAG: ABC transporter permease [Clostridia bacterium]|nr:ABC transporter permease [Clostridia bacterium]
MDAVVNWLLMFLPRAIRQGVPLLFGSTGEILTEKSGHLNLGIPGIMYMGGVSGIIGAFFYERFAGDAYIGWLAVLITTLSALLGAAVMALIYSFLTVTLRANQNVTGLALTTFGMGVGNFFGGSLAQLFGEGGSLSVKRTSEVFCKTLPFADDLGAVGTLLFDYGFLVYLSVAIALVVAWFLKKTRAGLNLRSVGEDPATADAAGINVTRHKYLSTVIGGAIAGLGGLYYIMDYTHGTWSDGGFGDRGWLAIALVIFALWKPASAIWGSFLFGGLYVLPAYLNFGDNRSMQYLVSMLPYVVTLVVLIITSMRKKREHQPPASLGLPYFREER